MNARLAVVLGVVVCGIATIPAIVAGDAPTADFTYSPDSPHAGDTITFDATVSSDPDGDIESYRWYIDDSSYSDGTGSTFRHTFETGGTYTITLEVEDSNGTVDTVSQTVTVINDQPTASYTYSPSTPNPDETISFDASDSADTDGDIVEYEWYIDGSSYADGTGQTFSTSFETGGTHTVELVVEDSGGATASVSKTITVENPAPTPSFTYSPSTPNPDETISFDASGSSDSDGKIVEYEWFIDGSTYADGSGQTFSTSFETGGTHTIRLEVTDNGELTRSTEQTITVENPAPNAAFTHSPLSPNPDDSITFDASHSSDPDGTIAEYNWYVDGSSYADGNGQTFTTSFETGGTHEIRLEVVDNGERTDTLSSTVTVENPTPTARFDYEPSAPSPDETITFDASDSTDPDGEVAEYNWYVDGSSYADGDGQRFRTSFDTAGTHRIRLEVVDNGEATASVSKTVAVENTKPVADFTIDQSDPHVGDSITFDAASSTDPDGTLTEYRWYVDGSEYSDGEGRSFTTAFDSAGTHRITLEVVDNGEATASATRQITVVNDPPVANFSWETLGNSLNVKVDAGASADPDGTITDYAWYVGDTDRRRAEGAQTTLSFDERGEYTVTLAVTGSGGRTVRKSKTVAVSRSPEATVEFPGTAVGTGSPVELSAAGSTDPDGEIERYRWQFPDGTTKQGREVEHVFETTGSHEVTVTVVDDTGNVDTTTATIEARRPPDVDFEWQPSEPRNLLDIVFTGNSTDNITSYRWDFDDDGQFETKGKQAVHKFNETGQHRVRLQVTSANGVTASATEIVTVQRSADFELKSGARSPTVDEIAIVTFSASNLVRNQSLETKLQIDLPTGVAVSAVEGGRLVGTSETGFVTVSAGGQETIRVTLEFDKPGDYNISGQAVYYLTNGSDRRESTVGPITLAVSPEETATATETENGTESTTTDAAGPGFGISLATLVAGLIGLWRRRRLA